VPKRLSDDGIPFYIQIKSDLQTEIKKQKPGDRIPSEEELAALYKVNRMTVRRAINDLVADGTLDRRRGVGTFVRHPRLLRDHGRLIGFYEEMTAQGHSVRSVILNREIVQVGDLARSMYLAPTDKVVRIKRLRYVDELPVNIDDNYLPCDPGLSIMKEDLENRSLYQLIEEHGAQLAKAVQRLEARRATPEQARLLQCKAGDPVLYGERVTFDSEGVVVILSMSCNRGDRYVMTMSVSKR